MRRFATWCAVLAASTLSVSVPAQASTPTVTITGPPTAAYNSVVTISGHTAHAGDSVTIYARRLTTRSYTRLPAQTSDDSRAYSHSFRLVADYAYFASSDGATTKVHITRIARASCSASGPAFPTLPFRRTDGTNWQFAAFSATRSGVWAGYSANFGEFNVLRWSKSHGLKVVDHFGYGGGIDNGAHGYVDVSGITPSGVIVAAVENSSENGTRGLYWVDGQRHTLSAESSWISVHPVRVANDGSVLGWAQLADQSYRLVRWASPTSTYQSIRSLPSTHLAVDAAGDVAWADDANDYVRLASGQYRTLTTPDGISVDMSIGGDHDVYASIAGLYRWNLGSLPASGPVSGAYVTPLNDDATATLAGSGRIVTGSHAAQHVVLSDGSLGTLPAQPSPGAFPGQAVDANGVLAVTSASDGLPHFVTCA